ncbi:MAG: hypothetical protein Q8L86_21075 [Vicinamibacterales bacterium]|nr:hypothetical protein [Vicinamibacterales bacterium]
MWRALLLFLLFVFIARAVWRLLMGVVQGASTGTPAAGAGARPGTPAVKMARDPICGTFVVPGKALSLVARGETIYFCSEKCRDAYGASAGARA